MKNVIVLMFIILFTSCSTAHRFKRYIKEDSYKACFIGDTGTGSTLQKEVALKLSQEKCHGVFFLGDVIYPSGLKNKSDPQYNQKFRLIYDDLLKTSARIHILLGNHDYRLSHEAWKDIARDDQKIFFPNEYYLVNYSGLCFVGLDSNQFKLTNLLLDSVAQSQWLRILNQNLSKKCSQKIIMAHHPYKSRGKHHGDASGYWKKMVEENILGQFDFFIYAHEHILSDEGRIQGTRLLLSGGGGDPDPGEPGGYLVVDFHRDGKKWKAEKVFYRKMENSFNIDP